MLPQGCGLRIRKDEVPSAWEFSLVSRKATVKKEKREEDGSWGPCSHGAPFFLEERIPCLLWCLCGRVGGSGVGSGQGLFPRSLGK